MSSTDGEMNLIDLVKKFSTVEAARDYLESMRWPSGVVCAHCGVVGNSCKLQGEAHRAGLYQCRDCRAQFTVTVGTIFEDSKIGLDKWMIAFGLLCASKKGMSSLQLSRMLKLSYKSAWHMSHRIRHAMQNGNFAKLDGIVEVDETYVGGKAKNVHKSMPIPKKTPVVALVSRSGGIKTRVITDVTADNLKTVLKEFVKPSAEIFTDGSPVYPQATKGFAGHESVNHDAREYVRGVVFTNTVESFNALVKRSIMGAWHSVSSQHLPKYIGEVAFRWDFRKVTDSERTAQALRQTEGCRLTYRQCKKVSHEEKEVSA